MMRVLFDTDIILDVFLKRAPFVEPAAALWLANEQGQIDGYVSAITPVNLFYVARKLTGVETARRAVVELIDAFRVCPVERTILQDALALPFHDFEDAVQHAAAVAAAWMSLSRAISWIMLAQPSLCFPRRFPQAVACRAIEHDRRRESRPA